MDHYWHLGNGVFQVFHNILLHVCVPTSSLIASAPPSKTVSSVLKPDLATGTKIFLSPPPAPPPLCQCWEYTINFTTEWEMSGHKWHVGRQFIVNQLVQSQQYHSPHSCTVLWSLLTSSLARPSGFSHSQLWTLRKPSIVFWFHVYDLKSSHNFFSL